VTVTWSAPASDGGAAITSYVVSANPGGSPPRTCTWTSGALKCTVTGLDNGRPYYVSVEAVNSVGNGLPSTPVMAIPSGGPGGGPGGGPSGGSGSSGSGGSSGAGSSSDPATSSGGTGSGASDAPVMTISRQVVSGPTLAQWVSVTGPGALAVEGTQLGGAADSAATEAGDEICAGQRRIRRAGRYVIACDLTTAAKRTLEAVPLRVRVKTSFRTRRGKAVSTVRVVVLKRYAAGSTAVTG
jgi:hypothetical protein